MRKLALLNCLLLTSCFYHSPIHTGEDEEMKKDLAEIKEGQAKILEKLASLEAAQAPRRPAAPAVDYSKVYEIDLADSPVRGEAKAPVAIVEFSDYQCPFCAQAESTVRQVLEENKGKVKLVFKNFPLEAMHPMAKPAALAALAAGAQGKYWEMHDALFDLQGQVTEEKIVEAAKKIGLDMKRFEADRKSEKVDAALKKDLAEAQKAEVRGTPTFFVNGKRVADRSPDGFRKMIAEATGK